MGNQTQLSVSAGTVASYDGENRMSKIAVGGSEIASYTYDAEGRRVVKTAGGATTYYVYDAFGQLMAEYGGPAQTAGTRYFTTDYLGSTRMILNGTGGCVERLDYAPFGGQISRSGQDCYGGASSEKPLYTGQMRDGESTAGTETGQDYFNARYLWAAIGRFTSPDAPFADQRPEDGQSWNMYAYVRNNPLRYVDPSGTKCVYNKGDSDQNTPIGDDGDGTGCPEAGVKPDSEGGLNASGQQENVTTEAGSWVEYLFHGSVPRYVENDVPLSESSRGTLWRVSQNTRFIVDAGDKIGACAAEEYFGIPMSAPGAVGAGMLAAGQPVLPTRAKFAANPTNILGTQSGMHPSVLVDKQLSTKGTSVASVVSRKALGNKAGRVVGRAIPFVGAGLLIADTTAIAACAVR